MAYLCLCYHVFPTVALISKVRHTLLHLYEMSPKFFDNMCLIYAIQVILQMIYLVIMSIL